MKLRRIFAYFMVLCLVTAQMTFPARGEDSATAAVMRMAGTEGEVTVASQNGKDISVKDDMKLYSGYHLSTDVASYAYVSLDGTKAVKLDALTRTEVRKSGKQLELLVSSGKLFFDVKAPLTEEENLNIRTSTMVTGIRGTAGVVEVMNGQVSTIFLLDGQVELIARDPVSGETRSAVLHAGQKATTVVGEDENGQGYARIFITDLTEEEIDGFAAMEIAKDKELQERIRNSTNLDVDLIVSDAADRLNRDQLEVSRQLALRTPDQAAGGEAGVDPVFTSRADGIDGGQESGGGQTASSGMTSGGSEHPSGKPTSPDSTDPTNPSPEPTGSDPTNPPPAEPDPTDPSDPTNPPAVPTITLDDMQSGNLDTILSDAFASGDEVNLSPETVEGTDQAPKIAEDILIPEGKTLNVKKRVEVAAGSTVTVKGTLNVDEQIDNYGTIINQAMDTFIIKEDAYFQNGGTFTNEGRLLVYGEFNAALGQEGSHSQFTNSGLIVNQNVFCPVAWGLNSSSGRTGTFVNEDSGRVENSGIFTVSYTDGSTPGTAEQWLNNEGGILQLDYQNEYISGGYGADFDSLCSQVMGTGCVSILNGSEEYGAVAMARSLEEILSAYHSYDMLRLLRPAVLSSDLVLDSGGWLDLYLNEQELTLEGASIVNHGTLSIHGGAGDTAGASGTVRGAGTDCVIENRGELILTNVNVLLEESAGGDVSYAVDNWGRLKFGVLNDGSGSNVTGNFENHSVGGWALANRWEEGTVVSAQSDPVSLSLFARTRGYTANMREDAGDEETAESDGYRRDLTIDRYSSVIIDGPLELHEATPGNASDYSWAWGDMDEEEGVRQPDSDRVEGGGSAGTGGTDTGDAGGTGSGDAGGTTGETNSTDTGSDDREIGGKATDSDASGPLRDQIHAERKAHALPEPRSADSLKEPVWKEDEQHEES